MPVATSILLVKIYPADAALILAVDPPLSGTTATPWDRQSSVTSLAEKCIHAE
jgi:hypothetical protein